MRPLRSRNRSLCRALRMVCPRRVGGAVLRVRGTRGGWRSAGALSRLRKHSGFGGAARLRPRVRLPRSAAFQLDRSPSRVSRRGPRRYGLPPLREQVGTGKRDSAIVVSCRRVLGSSSSAAAAFGVAWAVLRVFGVGGADSRKKTGIRSSDSRNFGEGSCAVFRV